MSKSKEVHIIYFVSCAHLFMNYSVTTNGVTFNAYFLASFYGLILRLYKLRLCFMTHNKL